MSVHPDKTATRAVDACGGTFTFEQESTGYAQGYRDALEVAARAVEPVDGRFDDLLKTLASAIEKATSA